LKQVVRIFVVYLEISAPDDDDDDKEDADDYVMSGWTGSDRMVLHSSNGSVTIRSTDGLAQFWVTPALT